MFLAQREQRLDIGKYLLLLRSPSSSCKSVACIARKSSGEIAAVVGVGSSGQSNLVPGINLGNPAHRQQQRKGGLEFDRITARLAHEASVIVIPKEGDQPLRMRIQFVLTQDVDDFLHRLAFDHYVAKSRFHRKIEHRSQPAVDAVELLAAALKE